MPNDNIARRMLRAAHLRLDLHARRTLIRMSTRRQSHGFTLASYTIADPWQPLFFAKVDRALALIAEADPRRFARIRRDVQLIAGERGGPSYWYAGLRMITLSWSLVLPYPSVWIAFTIVHEATHARIGDAGIPYEEPRRGRIEAACVAQEIAFAQRLAGGDAFVERLSKRLDSPWWTVEEFQKSQLRRARAHDVPEWYVRYLERQHRKETDRKARESGEAATRSAPSTTD